MCQIGHSFDFGFILIELVFVGEHFLALLDGVYHGVSSFVLEHGETLVLGSAVGAAVIVGLLVAYHWVAAEGYLFGRDLGKYVPFFP